ncbi:MAG TPA: branched-chain amino acid ABC transporter permease [Castellaniella sp.]|uniref:branched-chain amino acid ABC transporter permease n=1 Tax=Castellaniella sp. TaxID=1955812 RepID=UPI002EE798F3
MWITIINLLLLGLLWGGVYLLMATGLNLIYGVMKVVNLAHGDMIIVGGLLAFTLFSAHGISPIIAFPLAAGLLFLVGVAVQYLILEHIPVKGSLGELRTLLATFGLSYVIANTSFLIWGSQFQSLPFLQGSFQIGRIALPQALVAASILAFCTALALHLWLTHTMVGKSVRATAQSGLGAACCSLNGRLIRIISFGVGAALAGAAGSLVITLIPFQTTGSGDLTIQAFTIIALGGLGNYMGALIAAELLGIAEVFTQYYLGSNSASAVIYIVFIGVLIFRPQGLFGKVGRV